MRDDGLLLRSWRGLGGGSFRIARGRRDAFARGCRHDTLANISCAGGHNRWSRAGRCGSFTRVFVGSLRHGKTSCGSFGKSDDWGGFGLLWLFCLARRLFSLGLSRWGRNHGIFGLALLDGFIRCVQSLGGVLGLVVGDLTS